MPSRRAAAAARWSSRLGRLAFASLDASRWVRGGGGAGPRRLASASRRLGVGRPFRPPARCRAAPAQERARARRYGAGTSHTSAYGRRHRERARGGGSLRDSFGLVHIAVVVDAFGPGLDAEAAAAAVAAGWHAAAPDARLSVSPPPRSDARRRPRRHGRRALRLAGACATRWSRRPRAPPSRAGCRAWCSPGRSASGGGRRPRSAWTRPTRSPTSPGTPWSALAERVARRWGR